MGIQHTQVQGSKAAQESQVAQMSEAAQMSKAAPWKAQMVAAPWDDSDQPDDARRPPLIRCSFTLQSAPVSASLRVTALGVFEAEVNGSRVGRDILAPGWTVYDRRLQYWTYDVTAQLHEGANAMGFWLGDGWYRGRIGFNGGKADCYGSRLGVFAQLEVAYADGTVHIVASNADDGMWQAGLGPIMHSGLYEGETYDARREVAGFSEPGFTGGDEWQCVERLPFDTSVVQSAVEQTAVHCIGEGRPVSISRLADGRQLVDFGQNCTQRVVLRLPAMEPGRAVSVQHVEVLNPDGTPATRPLRRAVQLDRYISNGSPAIWEPRFTIHGFRYAVIEGWPEQADTEAAGAEAADTEAADLYTRIYSSVDQRTGWFSCSQERVNRLYQNALWSMRSNFVSIPTDCPQRDERFGWTGDIAVFAHSAEYLYDTDDFLSSWLDDVAIETEKWGTVPYYVPYPYPGWGKPTAVAIWSDATVMVPWAMYMAHGDLGLLRRHYPLARRWMDEVAELLAGDGVWDRKPDVWCGQLGDWLDPTAPPDDAAKAMTDKALVATAFVVHSADLMVRMAQALGDAAAAARYGSLAAHAVAGFQARFVRGDGRMTSDTQCAYALAIAFNLLRGDDESQLRRSAGDRLAELVRERDYVVGTGFAGTPYVLRALCDTGHVREAFRLFLSDRCPSWLYQVSMGATTTWERWDSMLPSGEVNPGDMTSFNHYAFGSVIDWMHGAIGGLQLTAPCWREFLVEPCIVQAVESGITEASAAYDTGHGKAAVSWHAHNEGAVELCVTVPEGSVAHIGSGLADVMDDFGPDSARQLDPGVHHMHARLPLD